MFYNSIKIIHFIFFIMIILIIYSIFYTIEIKGNNNYDFEEKALLQFMMFRYGNGNSDSIAKQLKKINKNTDEFGNLTLLEFIFKEELLKDKNHITYDIKYNFENELIKIAFKKNDLNNLIYNPSKRDSALKVIRTGKCKLLKNIKKESYITDNVGIISLELRPGIRQEFYSSTTKVGCDEDFCIYNEKEILLSHCTRRTSLNKDSTLSVSYEFYNKKNIIDKEEIKKVLERKELKNYKIKVDDIDKLELTINLSDNIIKAVLFLKDSTNTFLTLKNLTKDIEFICDKEISHIIMTVNIDDKDVLYRFTDINNNYFILKSDFTMINKMISKYSLSEKIVNENKERYQFYLDSTFNNITDIKRILKMKDLKQFKINAEDIKSLYIVFDLVGNFQSMSIDYKKDCNLFKKYVNEYKNIFVFHQDVDILRSIIKKGEKELNFNLYDKDGKLLCIFKNKITWIIAKK